MQSRGAWFASTEPHEGTGEFFQVGREIFCTHGREFWLGDVFFAQVFFADVLQEFNFFRCVDGSTVTTDVVQFGMGVEHHIQAFENFSQSLFHLVTKSRGVGSDGALQVCVFYTYVVTGAGIHEADGADHIFHRIHFTGNQGLHVDDEMSGCHQGIGAIVRLGGMGGFPFHVNVETIGSSHQVARFQTDHADRKFRPYVKAVDFRNIVQFAAIGNVTATADGSFFFGWLENQFHCAVKFVFHFIQYSGGSQKDCHVAVVTAGMHDAFVLGSERKAGLFGYRQGIHVSTESYGLARLSAFDDPQDGILEESGFKGDSQLGQLFLDVLGCIYFFSGNFWIAVEMTTPFDGFWNDFFDFGFQCFFTHSSEPLCSFW